MLRNLRFNYKVALIVVALLIPLGVAVQAQLEATSDDLAFARAERSGLVVLGPLSSLLDDTVTASMPAGSGRPLQLAARVAATDAALTAGRLRVTGWTPVRERLFALPQAGEARESAATQLIPDIVELFHEVADRSNLILDPELASYYLMDAMALRAPGLMALAGDAERAAADVADRDAARSLRGRVVLSSTASVLGEEIEWTAASLRKAATATPSAPVRATARALERDIRSLTGAVDAIRFAADDASGSAGGVASAARGFRRAGITLVTDGRPELDRLLAQRIGGLEHGRTSSLLQILAGLLLAGGLAISTHRKLSTLSDLSTLDALTGLGNHRAFQEEVHRAVAHARRYNEQLAVAAVDVDDFKSVNDRRGHRHGDAVLVQIAALLGGRTGDRAFRTGGDEFAVVLPRTDERAAAVALERLRAAVEAAPLPVTVSIGIAELASAIEADVLDKNLVLEAAEVLLDQADAAVYAAKHTGRNTVAAASAVIASAAITSAKVRALRALLTQECVDVAFQPIWRTDRSAILGYEALARLPLDAALAGPTEAFDVAEAVGKAADLDKLCLRSIWAAAAQLPPGVLLFVNVCPSTVEGGALNEPALAAAVAAAGLQPGEVVFEVTERRTVSAAGVVAGCQRLRDVGFHIALDDVGAGNSGLEMLRHLPVDFVKIDRDVLIDAQVGDSARGVLLAIVAFARQVGAQVIAEGIEDEQMLGFLLGMSPRVDSGATMVHGLQGYLLGRPGPLPGPAEPYDGPHRHGGIPLPRSDDEGPLDAAHVPVPVDAASRRALDWHSAP